jgi:hypothetical protein
MQTQVRILPRRPVRATGVMEAQLSYKQLDGVQFLGCLPGRGCRSVARSSRWHCEDRGFESRQLHQLAAVVKGRTLAFQAGEHGFKSRLRHQLAPADGISAAALRTRPARVRFFPGAPLALACGSGPPAANRREGRSTRPGSAISPLCWDRQGLLSPRMVGSIPTGGTTARVAQR